MYCEIVEYPTNAAEMPGTAENEVKNVLPFDLVETNTHSWGPSHTKEMRETCACAPCSTNRVKTTNAPPVSSASSHSYPERQSQVPRPRVALRARFAQIFQPGSVNHRLAIAAPVPIGGHPAIDHHGERRV